MIGKRGQSGPPRAVLLFHTSNQAIRAEALVQRAGLDCRLTPVPRQFSSDCGVSLRIARIDRDRITALLVEAGVEVAEVHDLE